MNFTTAKNLEFYASHMCVYIYLYMYSDNYLTATNSESSQIDTVKYEVRT